MGKNNKRNQLIGSWMSATRLAEIHVQLKEMLRIAQDDRPRDEFKIKQIKQQKLLCKDLIEEKKRPKLKLVPSPKKNAPAKEQQSESRSLFFGRQKLAVNR